MKFYLVIGLLLAYYCGVNAQQFDVTKTPVNETYLIKNADFETGNIQGWKHWRTKNATIVNDAYSGKYAVKIGPDRGVCNQEAVVRSNALYRISAFVKN